MGSRWITLYKGLNLVHPYQAIVYAGLVCWGIFIGLNPEPFTVPAMTPRIIYILWLILHFAAPAAVWLGQILHVGDPTPKQTLLGWELQGLGDISVFAICATTAYSFIQSGEPSGHYVAFVFAFWALCALVLTLRDTIAVGYYWGACHTPGFNPDALD